MSRMSLPVRVAARLSLALGAVVLSIGAARADVPRVAADIAPVHALVARVMAGVGAPDLIVSPGASPHSYQLRPSQARALQSADLVVWIGADLTPWMAEAVATLAQDAEVIGLLSLDGTQALAFREGAVFGGGTGSDAEGHAGHDHGADHDTHKETEHAGHDHGDKAEHAGHDSHDHDSHDHDSHDHDSHDHDGTDPHAWLSPDNAAFWIGRIAEDLARLDPANAATYRANAAQGQAEIAALVAEIDAALAPLRAGRFIVFHDAYQYFETRFALSAVGAISLGDASDPSPARIAELRDQIAQEGIDCVLAEPQFNPGLVAAVAEGSGARIGVLDPLGADLTPGPALYLDLLRGLGADLADCLKPAG